MFHLAGDRGKFKLPTQTASLHLEFTVYYYPAASDFPGLSMLEHPEAVWTGHEGRQAALRCLDLVGTFGRGGCGRRNGKVHYRIEIIMKSLFSHIV